MATDYPDDASRPQSKWDRDRAIFEAGKIAGQTQPPDDREQVYRAIETGGRRPVRGAPGEDPGAIPGHTSGFPQPSLGQRSSVRARPGGQRMGGWTPDQGYPDRSQPEPLPPDDREETYRRLEGDRASGVTGGMAGGVGLDRFGRPSPSTYEDEAGYRPGPLPSSGAYEGAPPHGSQQGTDAPGAGPIATPPAGVALRAPGGGPGVAGGAPGVPGGRLALNDQRRVTAYDPVADADDPGNVHLVAADGRRNVFYSPQTPGQAIATEPNRNAGGDGLNSQGSSQGLSTNNVHNDMTPALKAGSSWLSRIFHQDKRDEHSDRGYHAMVVQNVGAPDINTVDQVFKAVDPKNELPMNRKMELAIRAGHDWLAARAQQAKTPEEKADLEQRAGRFAGEMMQFGVVQSKAHGKLAVEALKNGNTEEGVRQLEAGYGWLADGHHTERRGNILDVVDQDGRVTQSIPITPAYLNNIAAGMASGEFGHDIHRSRSEAAPPAPQGAPPGAGPPPVPRAIAPTAPAPVAPPPGQPAAQPSAVPAGPSQTPAAPATVPPAATASQGSPAPQPPTSPNVPAAAPARTHDGLPARQNPDGSISTELSITVTDPRLNGGRPTNIPSLWGGREVLQDQAVTNALQSGKPYQSFNNISEAVKAAEDRSAAGGANAPASPQTQGVTPRVAPTLTPTGPPAPPAAGKPPTQAPAAEVTPPGNGIYRHVSEDPPATVKVTLPPIGGQPGRTVTATLDDAEKNLESVFDRKRAEIMKETDALPKSEAWVRNKRLEALGKQQAAATATVKEQRAEYNRALAAANAAERKHIAPHAPGQSEQTEMEGVWTKREQQIREGAADKKNPDRHAADLMATSPLRYMDTPVKARPLMEVARAVKVNNNAAVDAQQAYDIALEITRHVPDTSGGKPIDPKLVTNGKIGKDGAFYKEVGRDVNKNPVIVTENGYTISVPQNVLKAADAMRKTSYDTATEAEKKAAADSEKRAADRRKLGKMFGRNPLLGPAGTGYVKD